MLEPKAIPTDMVGEVEAVTPLKFEWHKIGTFMVKFFNKSIFGKVLLEIEKVVKTFSIFDKLFPKLVYYCKGTH